MDRTTTTPAGLPPDATRRPPVAAPLFTRLCRPAHAMRVLAAWTYPNRSQSPGLLSGASLRSHTAIGPFLSSVSNRYPPEPLARPDGGGRQVGGGGAAPLPSCCDKRSSTVADERLLARAPPANDFLAAFTTIATIPGVLVRLFLYVRASSSIVYAAQSKPSIEAPTAMRAASVVPSGGEAGSCSVTGFPTSSLSEFFCSGVESRSKAIVEL
mmetsp:Transcript_11476/g.30265  ORF Transcript_11476/g.30265 Transcript_11476/m.30265 type:complete len:212 (-) Transcript_11476:760-1395(-)